MTRPDDAVPEPIQSERSRRTTIVFCTDQLEGFRCMLVKGHTGEHECLASIGLARWPASDAP